MNSQQRPPVRPTNNADVSRHLEQQGAKPTTITFEDQVRTWFIKNGKRLRGLVGSEAEARRLLLASLNTISKIPSLVECDFTSYTRCLMTAAELRLIPGMLGQCAFVPFNNRKSGKKEATFILGYQGLIELMHRAGAVMDIDGDVVHENDHFEYVRGTHRKLVFEPATEDRGEAVGVYTIIRTTNGGLYVNFMTAGEVNGIKERSPAARGNDSPWNSTHQNDRDWMWLKTSLKQNSKWLPKTAELEHALTVDEEPEESLATRQKAESIARTIGAAAVEALPAPHEGVSFAHTSTETVPVDREEGAKS